MTPRSHLERAAAWLELVIRWESAPETPRVDIEIARIKANMHLAAAIPATLIGKTSG